MHTDQVLNWSTHLRLREKMLQERVNCLAKSLIQSSSREELSTSHMIAGKGRNKPSSKRRPRKVLRFACGLDNTR
ncbi:hypothetical protein H5410_060827 [Solanum commersonii]|uniref:Uncharacterized protein n=1 Tax=Solanum commersonii TaxID=4109 RepID=A0A9J5W637_SOLCO|nr:hypothetical protein H5410_060827 [Solanum commersonii]